MFATTSVDFASKWSQLSDVVSKLIRCDHVSRERWNNSFHDVYALCHSRPSSHAATLYSSTTSLISVRVKEIASELDTTDDLALLSVYANHWDEFHRGLTCLDNLYRVVNQQYVKNLRPTEAEMCYGAILPMADRHTMEILEVGLAHWKLYLIDNIKLRLSRCLMREVANDRCGIDGQQSTIPKVLQSFLDVGKLRDIEKAGMDIYNEIFHEPLLNLSKEFYSHWAAQKQNELSCSNYINEALALRQQEENRVTQYYKNSGDNVLALFQQIVVKDRLEFLNRSVQQMVAEEHKTDLCNLYLLLAPNNLYTELSRWFGQQVATCTRKALSDLSSDPMIASTQFVDSLLSLRDQFTLFLNEVFDGNNTFRDQMDKAFNLAINERTPNSAGLSPSNTQSQTRRPSELLCRYMDSLLRNSIKSVPQSEVETKLKSLITIFKYLDDKDMFQRFYQKMLFKRLIFNASPAMDLEELVIGQLKVVCGYEFTNKFHRMFNDIQLGPELNRDFAQYLKSMNVNYKFGYQFNILTQCSWPISPSNNTEFNLPTELQQCTSHFENFYASRYQGRKMRWTHQFSTVELALFYLPKPYQVYLSVMHAAILLQYNLTDSFRIPLRDFYGQVHMTNPSLSTSSASIDQSPGNSSVPPNSMDMSSMESVETVSAAQELVQRLLVPLLEIQLLYLEQGGQIKNSLDSVSLEPDTWVVLNENFQSKRLKIRVTATSNTKEAIQAEAHKVEQQVTDDRRYFIKAAIVRIMKARKQMDHTALVAEVVQQASGRFHASTTLIKQCIENLIEQDYLERSPGGASQYNYLA
ncbi:Cullin-2 [Fasciolopsis buskii]|uniref:Cullin-2 n=1 Tax=Fasciolopsis buskii TaxID=27845 RepID=A0A8E0RXV8_9TREM|nr:Cullin-2 [Fasciolopsis buski]